MRGWVSGVGVAAGEEVVDEDTHPGVLVVCIVLEGWGGFGVLRFSARGGRYFLSVVECRVSLAVVRQVVRVCCLLGSVWAFAFEWGCVDVGRFHGRRKSVLVGVVSGSTVNVRGRLRGGQFDEVRVYIGIEVMESMILLVDHESNA